MQSHQKKYFSQGLESINFALETGETIDAQNFIDLMNKSLSATGSITETIVHRDAKSLEMTGSTVREIKIADLIGHHVAGQIYGLVEFANLALKAGVRLKTVRPTTTSIKAAEVLALNRNG